MVSQQPEALRLADSLVLCWGDSRLDEAAAELRRLHAENEDYGATIDYLTCENAERIGEIVALKEQRDELLEALSGLVGCIDHGSQNPTQKLEVARAAIAKATGETK